MFVSYEDCGDAWVRAPDGSVATLIWETGEPAYFAVSIEPDELRWGTYAVQLPLGLTTDVEASAYLGELLPELRPRWQEWKRGRKEQQGLDEPLFPDPRAGLAGK